MQGTQVRSLVEELRSHVLWSNSAHAPQGKAPKDPAQTRPAPTETERSHVKDKAEEQETEIE